MTQGSGSRWPGFFRLGLEERIEQLSDRQNLDPETRTFLTERQRLPPQTADHMIENCIGTFELPLGLAMNLRVNGEDRLVPMAVEEPSVVAGLSKAARYLRSGEGIRTTMDPPVMIGQVQLMDVPDVELARRRVLAAEEALLGAANALDPALVEAGGGAVKIETRVLPPYGPEDPLGTMFVVHVLVDVRDAMGANAVNTMVEGLAPRLAQITGGRARLRILSNLADRRLARAVGEVPVKLLGTNGVSNAGLAIARGIEEASVFAERDPYRAATGNKGIMNGVDAVLVALGQDWRAVESGAHAYAARSGQYRSLSRWRVHGDILRGEIELPLAVGTVGGIVETHPAVRAAFKILGVKNGSDLAGVAASVGLAQNLGAINALATVGIQRGHMRLHARKLGLSLGADEEEIAALSEALHQRSRIDLDLARELLEDIRHRSR